MRRFLLRLAAAAVSWQALSCVGEAQLVQVGPGYVKAPFVRVYSFPNGGSYVKAPFVEVFNPGYAFAPGYGGDPGYGAGSIQTVLPTADQLAQMNWASLSQGIHDATTQLNGELDAIATGGDWKNYLKTNEIIALLPTAVDAAPSDDVRRQLNEALARFQATRQSPEAQSITASANFQLVESLLGEYVSPADVRLRRQLFSAAGELSRVLRRFATGSDWQQYLALSPGMALSQEYANEPSSPQSIAEFTKAREQFDAASQSAESSPITSLPAFALTRQRLIDYLAHAGSPQSQSAEELPAPDRGPLQGPSFPR